jgi:hypothetical protein
MSQQINLLQEKQRPPVTAALLAMGVMSLGVLAIALYGSSVSESTRALRRQADLGSARLGQTKASMASLQLQQSGAAARGTSSDLQELRTRAESARRLSASVREASFATQSGFSRQLMALNSAGTQGVWLTAADFQKAGTQPSLSGGAVSSEAVLLYARRLNESMRPLGLRFNNVEVLPESGAASAAPTMVSFKLY